MKLYYWILLSLLSIACVPEPSILQNNQTSSITDVDFAVSYPSIEIRSDLMPSTEPPLLSDMSIIDMMNPVDMQLQPLELNTRSIQWVGSTRNPTFPSIIGHFEWTHTP
jgi:hypothetical protein